MQRFVFWIPALIWMGVIFYLSTIPGSNFPAPFPFADKVAHFVFYAVLGFWVMRAIACHKGIITRDGIILATLLAAFYGVTDEIHQLYVPLRSLDVWDWCVDIIGGLAGTYLYVVYNDILIRKLCQRK